MEDPYNRIFHQISGQRQYIESSTEWKEYLEALYHHGLLNDEELNKIRTARRFVEKKTSRISFQDFQKAVLEIHATKPYDTVDSGVQNIQAQAQSYSKVAEQWGINKFDEIQVHQALSLLQELEHPHTQSNNHISKHLTLHRGLLKNQAAYTFFWSKLSPSDAVLYPGEGPTPFQYQYDNTIAIERVLYKRKLRHVKLCKRGARLETLPDVFGHSKTGRDGIMILKGSYPHKTQHAHGVQVVAVSKHGVSEAIYNKVSAHRQMALSSSIQHYLGSDTVSSPDDSFFYYENIPVTPMRQCISSAQFLDEKSYLFRHWSRSILAALRSLLEQCTHTILHPLRLDHFMTANSGVRVFLGRVDYGDSISQTQQNIQTVYAEREKLFALDFGIILHSMLCPTTVPTNPFTNYISGDDGILEYKIASEDGIIHLAHGDTFAFQLEQRKGYHWDRPVLDNDAVEPVLNDNVAGRFVFRASAPSGTCSILFRCCESGNTGRPPELRQATIHIHKISISPELRGILRCCVGDSIRVPTLQQLAIHPYFYKSRLDQEEDMVLVEYERLECLSD